MQGHAGILKSAVPHLLSTNNGMPRRGLLSGAGGVINACRICKADDSSVVCLFLRRLMAWAVYSLKVCAQYHVGIIMF